jgi:hypothetical protein
MLVLQPVSNSRNVDELSIVPFKYASSLPFLDFTECNQALLCDVSCCELAKSLFNMTAYLRLFYLCITRWAIRSPMTKSKTIHTFITWQLLSPTLLRWTISVLRSFAIIDCIFRHRLRHNRSRIKDKTTRYPSSLFTIEDIGGIAT